MNLLHGKTILYKNELISAHVALKKKSLVLYYFTSPSSDACKEFDLRLKNVYQEAVIRRMEWAVVVICIEPDKDTFLNYLKSNYQEWHAVQYNDELSHVLIYNYGITHTPSLVVVRKSGEIVTKDGNLDIEKIGINVLVTWAE